MPTPRPYTLVAELTYTCPLRCLYCSNPVNFQEMRDELNTEQWCRTFSEAADLGVVQLHLSGGEPVVREAQARYQGRMEIAHVKADYYAEYPKPCMGGWGRNYMCITPIGEVLPCHAAHVIPGLRFDSVRDQSLTTIWEQSPALNAFRGDSWMQEPCRSCPRKTIDLGGCRCQAFLLAGDAAATDPVCHLSPRHHVIAEAIAAAERHHRSLTHRDPRNSQRLSTHMHEPDARRSAARAQ